MSESDYDQDLSEVLESCGLSLQPSNNEDAKMSRDGDNEGEERQSKASTSETMTGKVRRKKRKMRNEPESIIGELITWVLD